ncbi:MAG: electron transfer flavoprotein subunit alpha/FixB family protein, partial [Acidobacteriota bacterium]
MAGILVFVEQRDGEVRKASLQALSEAKRQATSAGWSVSAVVPGSGVGDIAGSLGAWGAGKVFVADDPNLGLYSAEGYAEAVVKAAEQEQPSAIFFAGTAMGRDLAPRVAARLGIGAIPDAVELSLEGETFTVRRPVYSGKAFATANTAGKMPQIIGLRPNVFAAEETGGTAEVVALEGLALSIRAVVKELVAAAGGELDIAEANIIVSGGRGIKGPENFALIRELADALGGAVGASRAAVDAGWIDHSHQVGQTG